MVFDDDARCTKRRVKDECPLLLTSSQPLLYQTQALFTSSSPFWLCPASAFRSALKKTSSARARSPLVEGARMAKARKLTQEIDKTPSLHVFRYAVVHEREKNNAPNVVALLYNPAVDGNRRLQRHLMANDKRSRQTLAPACFDCVPALLLRRPPAMCGETCGGR